MYRLGLTRAWAKPHMEGGECCILQHNKLSSFNV